MSGRLIILPKKSWHPGRRENIEKVLRDERLAAEEAAAARERGREITQEGIIETLTKKRYASDQKTISEEEALVAEKPADRKRKHRDQDDGNNALGGKGQGWGSMLQHVNLFSDAEREAEKLLGQNADHQREKKEQELQIQKRSGLAPTALGEGSAELKDKDSQPWYTQVGPSPLVTEKTARTIRLGREVTGKEAEEAIKRDHGRRSRADPMGFLFQSGVGKPDKRPVLQSKDIAQELVGSTCVGMDKDADDAVRRSEIDRFRKGKKRKREKRGKKDKKRKSEKTKTERRRRSGDCDSVNKGDPIQLGANNSRGTMERIADAESQQSLEHLRSRRLAREGGERERQIRLLAEREMAGQSLPDERSMAYNNQYNAGAARQNRDRTRTRM